MALYGHDYGAHVTARTLAYDVADMFACGLLFQPFDSWSTMPATYAARYATFGASQWQHQSATAVDWVRSIGTEKWMFVVHGYDVASTQSSLRVRDAFQSDARVLSVYPGVLRRTVNKIGHFLQQCFDGFANQAVTLSLIAEMEDPTSGQSCMYTIE